MKRCFVYSAGSFYGVRECPAEGDLRIAADAGLLLCRRLGFEPDIVIGDFDSMEEPDVREECIRVPVEKDDTDTLLAVRVGLSHGCREFHLYGCTGGYRPDHTLANMQTLAFLCRREARGFMYDRNFVFTVIENGSVEIERTLENGTVSVFAMTDKVYDVTLEGLQYPLDRAELTPDFPLGVSNHFMGDRARISCGRGLLLVCWEVAEKG